MTRVEQEVRQWPRALQERWIHMSGSHMSDGATQEIADQRAYLTLRGEVAR